MGLVTRKSVFGVCDQVRLKLACTATEARWRLEISDIETRGTILSRQRIIANNKGADQTVPTCRLICTYQPAPLLFAYGINRFSHDVDHMRVSGLSSEKNRYGQTALIFYFILILCALGFEPYSPPFFSIFDYLLLVLHNKMFRVKAKT